MMKNVVQKIQKIPFLFMLVLVFLRAYQHQHKSKSRVLLSQPMILSQ